MHNVQVWLFSREWITVRLLQRTMPRRIEVRLIGPGGWRAQRTFISGADADAFREGLTAQMAAAGFRLAWEPPPASPPPGRSDRKRPDAQ